VEVVSRDPHPALRALVTGYWGYTEEHSPPLQRRELPSGDVVLVVGFGDELRFPEVGDECRSFVAGLTEASVVTETVGRAAGMQVNLTPLGTFALLGVPMHTLANRAVDLADVLSAADELEERLYEAPSWDVRFELVDATLLARLARAAQPAPSVAWSWQRLIATEGRVPVSRLTEELGCSRKHLASRFREQIGLTPKTAARILRFQRAVGRLAAGVSLGRLALDCGYYDQAHFNRDFRQFAGSTPSEFLARRYPDGWGLAPE
jgi:AraC-like DNA-binding protein